MTLDDKVQYDIDREAAKTSGLSSGKVDKYEFLTGEEKLSSDHSKIIKQAKFTYFHWFHLLSWSGFENIFIFSTYLFIILYCVPPGH